MPDRTRGAYSSLVIHYIYRIFLVCFIACASPGYAGVVPDAAYQGDPDKHPGTVWIAGENSLVNLASYTGKVRFTLDNLTAIQTLATDAETGNLWVVSAAGLQGFAPDGTSLLSTPVQIPVVSKQSGQGKKGGKSPGKAATISALVVDGKQGQLWLAADNQLHRFSISGAYQGVITLAFPISHAVLDRDASLLWVAGDRQLAALDSDGVVQTTQTLVAPITALVSAASNEQLVVVTPQSLLWYSRSGELQKQTSNPMRPAAEFAAADGRGGSGWQTTRSWHI